MSNNNSLARWCAYAGIAGIVLGVVAGIMGLMNPSGAYLAGAQGFPYNIAESTGRTMIIIVGVAFFGFTASFIGFHLVGAVGDGLLGKTATALSAIGNLGSAVALIHSGISGGESPLFAIGYALLLGFPLLTVAALRVKRVSALKAWMPVLILLGLFVIEFAAPKNGVMDMLHQAVYGAMSFVVLSELNKA